MASAAQAHPGAPMMEVNTTPLIDVMLVLLIMLILTIPVANNAVAIELPGPNPLNGHFPIHLDKNKLTLTAQNQIIWNGVALSEPELVATLQANKAMAVEPELQFEHDAYASYEIANRLMRDITKPKLSKFEFVHNALYATFKMQ